MSKSDLYGLIDWIHKQHRRGLADVQPASTLNDLSQLPSVWELDKDIEWSIDGLLPKAGVTLLTSESGTGKTWLAHAISGAVAQGEPFVGFDVQQSPVLYLDGENPVSVVRRNLESLSIPKIPQFKIWGGWVDTPPPSPDSPIIQQFAQEEKGLVV